MPGVIMGWRSKSRVSEISRLLDHLNQHCPAIRQLTFCWTCDASINPQCICLFGDLLSPIDVGKWEVHDRLAPFRRQVIFENAAMLSILRFIQDSGPDMALTDAKKAFETLDLGNDDPKLLLHNLARLVVINLEAMQSRQSGPSDDVDAQRDDALGDLGALLAGPFWKSRPLDVELPRMRTIGAGDDAMVLDWASFTIGDMARKIPRDICRIREQDS